MTLSGLDADAERMIREQLIEEAVKLRLEIRTHRDGTLHELCGSYFEKEETR